MQNEQIDWPGQSGTIYRYYLVYQPRVAAAVKPVAANYAFLKQMPSGLFVVLYFGETDNLSERLSGHECWPKAVRLGVNHVVAHPTPNAMARYAEERDLISRWNPPMNKQHRTIA
jgi:hypothetical protein